MAVGPFVVELLFFSEFAYAHLSPSSGLQMEISLYSQIECKAYFVFVWD